MPLVVGIDEAGYGPTLGPLVVGASLWRVGPRDVAVDWWDRLSAAVCRNFDTHDARLPVNDSKQVFDRHRGITSLERSVLAFAQVAGHATGTAATLLAALSDPGWGTSRCPWYAGLSPTLPLDPERSACTGAAERLKRTMATTSLTCLALRAEVITEDRFNERLAQTRNKAAVLLELVLRLVHWAGRQTGDTDLYVHVDRLGGRIDYRAALMTAFPDRHLHVISAAPEQSNYRLASPVNDWHVSFTVDGDQHHLPIALGSMVAKYVRELVMHAFNAWWQQISPELVPTAGYHRDAQRFLADITPHLERAGVPVGHFVRAR